MRLNDADGKEFSGTITLTGNSSRELFKVLEELDEAFINDVLCGRCGFTLIGADGRSVELVPNTNKRCQSVESVERETRYCEDCKHYDDINGHCFFIGRCTYKPNEQTERSE